MFLGAGGVLSRYTLEDAYIFLMLGLAFIPGLGVMLRSWGRFLCRESTNPLYTQTLGISLHAETAPEAGKWTQGLEGGRKGLQVLFVDLEPLLHCLFHL